MPIKAEVLSFFLYFYPLQITTSIDTNIIGPRPPLLCDGDILATPLFESFNGTVCNGKNGGSSFKSDNRRRTPAALSGSPSTLELPMNSRILFAGRLGSSYPGKTGKFWFRSVAILVVNGPGQTVDICADDEVDNSKVEVDPPECSNQALVPSQMHR